MAVSRSAASAAGTLALGENVSQGDVLAIDAPSGDAFRAESLFSSGLWAPIAVARTAGVLGNSIVVALAGELVGVNFASAPAAASNGSPVFLSATPGQGTLVPTFGSGRVIYVLGTLQGADGATSTPTVAFNPQFLSHRL